MDQLLGPQFARLSGVQYQGIGRGSWGLAQLLKARQMRADVFISATGGPIRMLLRAGLTDRAVPIASTEMVIAYNPGSRFAHDLARAADGKLPWYQVLRRRGFRFGRTDPAVDPQGRNVILTMLLAEKYYRQPGLADEILGEYRDPREIFTEASLLSRLESGQLDGSAAYLAAVQSRHLPCIRLPAEINLGDPAQAQSWYRTVQFRIPLPDGSETTVRSQPLVFYAGVLRNGWRPERGGRFVNFLLSPAGQKQLALGGYGPPMGGALR